MIKIANNLKSMLAKQTSDNPVKKLVGDQDELDVNNNEELDEEDFKLLRANKSADMRLNLKKSGQAKKPPAKEEDPPTFLDEEDQYENDNPQTRPLTWGEVALLTGGGLAGAAGGGYGTHAAGGTSRMVGKGAVLGGVLGLYGAGALAHLLGTGPTKARSPRDQRS